MPNACEFIVRATPDVHQSIVAGFTTHAQELRARSDEEGLKDSERSGMLSAGRAATATVGKVAKLADGEGVLEVDIYDIVGDYYYGGMSARYMRSVLQYAPAAKTIRLRINSQGGDVIEGFAIHNLLAAHAARIEAQVDGLAASIASVIAMAADKITMAASSWMMIHNPWGAAQGEAHVLRDWADVLDKMGVQAADIYAARTKLSQKRVLEMMKVETWLTAEEAMGLGFADAVTSVKKSSARAYAMMRVDDLQNVPEELRNRIESARGNAKARRAGAHPLSAEEPIAGLKVVPFKSYPLKNDGGWDGAEVVMRLREWASSDGSGDHDTIDWVKYRRAFTWYDSDSPEIFGSYKLPHHDVEDGELVTSRAGVIAAGDAVSGSRSGTSIPDSEVPAVRSHLARHFEEFELVAPWEAQDSSKKGTPPESPAAAVAQAPAAAPESVERSPAAPAAIDQTPADGGLNARQTMDIKLLKEQHPELFKAVLQEGIAQGTEQGVKLGVEQERKRVNAHLKMAKNTGANDVAFKAIESGVSVLDEEIHAEYMSAAMNRTDRAARQAESDAAAAATAGAAAAGAAVTTPATPAEDLGDKVVAKLKGGQASNG
jgi:ATP-dependent protease ClpP protease subunit